MINKSELLRLHDELKFHLEKELLPFWMARGIDFENGGFLTHFDKDGIDTGEDEKSLIAQSRSLYTYSSAHRAGYGQGRCLEMAREGIKFLIEKMWDPEFGGFYWMVRRNGKVLKEDKVLYGHSFAIYSLSEYTLATGDPVGQEYAEKIFDLIQEKCFDPGLGGYFEMFDRQWRLAGIGSGGGDRKTLDVHMHLMEAFTTLYECSSKVKHRKSLQDVIDLLIQKVLHPKFKTGIPQFTADWQQAPQIKFDIIWGWDRFQDGSTKENPEDNTCFGHNAEFAWLLIHALRILGTGPDTYRGLLHKIFRHTLNNGIDWEYGGVYVEGPHAGGVYDREKEFWQQAEVLIGMLDAFLLIEEEEFLKAYINVHRFILDKGVNQTMGEWWPLLTREGIPIWTHMGHSWKINYHTVRSMIKSIQRLDTIIEKI
jgi:mannobiose 2-epimerase